VCSSYGKANYTLGTGTLVFFAMKSIFCASTRSRRLLYFTHKSLFSISTLPARSRNRVKILMDSSGSHIWDQVGRRTFGRWSDTVGYMFFWRVQVDNAGGLDGAKKSSLSGLLRRWLIFLLRSVGAKHRSKMK
jgi:hypothetical protein